MKRLAAALAILGLVGAAGGPASFAKDKPPAKAAGPAADQHGDQRAGGFDFADQKTGMPLEVYADQGLELSQDAKTVIGRGNAKAVRGRVTVKADVLIAHYRDKAAASGKVSAAKPTPSPDLKDPDQPAGDSEIWRLEGSGHVTIASDTQTAYGDHADYNIDDAVVVLTGKDLKLVTPTDVVTARDSMEYWEHRQQAVARGQAMAVRGDKRIQADILVADFGENGKKQMAMQRAHGYDNVVLTTPREVVTGDRADYDAKTGIVTISGSVKMTREENQLNGGYAVVNLNTGISRLFPAAPGGAETGARDRQVKGLFIPQKKQTSPPSSSAPDQPTKARP